MAGKEKPPKDIRSHWIVHLLGAGLALAFAGLAVYQRHQVSLLEARLEAVEQNHVYKRSLDKDLISIIEQQVQKYVHELQGQLSKTKVTRQLGENHCNVTCPRGQKGEPGIHGESGFQGLKGEPGESASCPTNCPRGAPGPRGPKGDKGDRGPQGPTGSSGPPGPKGDRGSGSGGGPLPQECCLRLSYPQAQGKTTEVVQAQVGQEVILPCQGLGYPPPTVTWNPQSLAQIGAGRYDKINVGLNIHNVKPTDNGKVFECSLGNIFGTSKKHIRLQVTEPISVSITPTNPSFLEGATGNLKLHCNYQGFPTPTIIWQHILPNKQTATITKNIDNHVNGVSTLTLHNPTVTDAGRYICRAANSGGSKSATVDVVVSGAPHFITPPQNQTQLTGSTVTVTCEVLSNPAALVTWIFPHGQRSPRFNVHENPDHSLTITKADNQNEGTYTCVAQNSHGLSQATGYLTMIDPVTVTLNPPTNSLKNPYISLECRAHGDPTPSVSWSKLEGSIDRTDGRHIILGGDLVISGITPATKNKDSGVYVCTATNGQSTAKKQAIVYKEIKTIDCTTKFQACVGTPGVACGGTCPAGCTNKGGNLFGYKDYTANSPVCKAGIHSGVITDAGGLVTWVLRDGSLLSFAGERHNGITSSSTGPIHGAATVFTP